MNPKDIDIFENEKIGEFWNDLQEAFSECSNDESNDPFTQLDTEPEEAYVLACMPLDEVVRFLVERNFELKISYNNGKK